MTRDMHCSFGLPDRFSRHTTDAKELSLLDEENREPEDD
ncbi:hypothetical protein BN1012_Phect2201 [Candidatus Phaeomarinobacter ectocarpi]|uniref:Uncharacterized protein n=1 Tax=Candidatus Phaeomarinibacter ectocarpi TaxID=1458461 RepID=X5MG74_9HYPH|nr:hypothetical protein BN1012_Phect2201 [Candidatus Phaeomarinobacter ectocarpi]